MLPRESIRKAKVLILKSFRNFKSLVFGGYQRLPRSLSFNPFLGRSCNARTYTSDQFYNEFYDMLQSDLNKTKITNNDDTSMTMSREPSTLEDEAAVAESVASNFAKQSSSSQKSVPEDRVNKEKKNKGDTQLRKKEDLNSKKVNEGAHVLAKKMKELEMMDSGDVEHVLDIEEALHYYSRLTSPVYLDIVDKFFMDMHSELSVPQQSTVRIKRSKSKGRIGSLSGCR